MAGFTAQGATFTFSGSRGQFSANVTGLTVTTPEAEVVDMTGVDDPLAHRIMVPTGDWAGGDIQVEYIASSGGGVVDGFVSDCGNLSFIAPGIDVTRRAILVSADRQIRVGDIVRGSLRFTLTDYAGS